MRKHNFKNRVTDIWNDLPQELVQAKTVKSFEILLDKYWENREVKYDHNEDIRVRTGSHKKKFIVDIDEEDANIVVEKPASIEDPKVARKNTPLLNLTLVGVENLFTKWIGTAEMV